MVWECLLKNHLILKISYFNYCHCFYDNWTALYFYLLTGYGANVVSGGIVVLFLDCWSFRSFSFTLSLYLYGYFQTIGT